MPSVLYIEKDSTLARSMTRVFSRTWNVTTTVKHVSTVKAALEAMAIERFDVIVSAYHFHDGTGYDIFAWIASFRPTMAERLVFLTGNPEAASELVGRVVEKGAPVVDLKRVLREVVPRSCVCDLLSLPCNACAERAS